MESSQASPSAPGSRSRTRERILEGAIRAVGLHGLTKLGMGDVCESAGVSRGTLYRYFPTREELLSSLAHFEAQRFYEQLIETVRRAPPGEARLQLILEHTAKHVQEHAALQRLLVTEPGNVLEGLRAAFPELRSQLRTLFEELVKDSPPVRQGVVESEQLIDWLTRFLVTFYLFPDPEPERMAHGITQIYRAMVGQA